MDWLSFGKLRVSYATTGKGPYAAYVIDKRFVPQVTTGGGFILDVTGGNTELKPEFSKNLEIGTELKFFKSRLGIDAAFYQINTKDQIITNRLSYGTGYVLQWINGGLVENKGVEIQLTGTPILKKNFSWNITLNFDHNKGIVKRLPADLPLYYDSDTWLAGNLRSQVSAGTSIYNLAAYTLQRNSKGQLLISPTTGLPLKDNNFRNVGDRNPISKWASSIV
jgi:outer membrane receptor protein involved in Fe transport